MSWMIRRFRESEGGRVEKEGWKTKSRQEGRGRDTLPTGQGISCLILRRALYPFGQCLLKYQQVHTLSRVIKVSHNILYVM